MGGGFGGGQSEERREGLSRESVGDALQGERGVLLVLESMYVLIEACDAIHLP